MLDDISVAIIGTLVPLSALCYAYFLDMHRIRRYRLDSGITESREPVLPASGMTPAHKHP